MINSGKLVGKTLFTGKEVALGTNAVFAVKSAKSHRKPPGTILTIPPALGTAKGIAVDLGADHQEQPAAGEAVQKLGWTGSLDNASANKPTPERGFPGVLQKKKKTYHLNNSHDNRSTLTTSKICQHYVKESSHQHTLNLNSPINMKNHVCAVPKMAEDFRSELTAVNTFWTMTSEKKSPPDFFFKEVTVSNKMLLPKNLEQKRMMSTMTENRAGIEKIMTRLNEKFNTEIVNDVKAIYQFNITSGDSREIYHIDLRNGSGRAGRGKSEEDPDTIFCIDLENFNKLVKGNLKAPTAFMTGRMKISGSMQKAALLEKLFMKLMEKQSDISSGERVQSMHN